MSDTLTNALRDSAHSSSVLAGIANPAQFNPLAGMSTAMDMAGKMQGLDKTLSERNAGRAFLNSIDPQTGKPNQALLMQNLKGDPSTAYAAQHAAQSGQTLDADTYKLHSDRLGALHSAAAQLIADNPNGVPQDAINRVIQNQVTLGNISPQEAQAVTTTFGADPRRNTQTLLQGLGRNIGAQTALDASRPPMGQNDTGAVIQRYQGQSPLSSAPPTAAVTPAGQPIIKTPTPSELVTPQTQTTPGGQSVTAPAYTRMPPAVVPPHLQGQPGGQNPMGTGRYPTPQGGAGGGSGTGQPGAGNIPGAGGAPVTVDPLAVGGNEADFKQYRADVTGVGQHYQNINTLNNARSALEQARTGKGITPFQTLMSVINTIAPGWTPDATKTQTEQYDLAKKYLSDYARNSGAATHSDAQLSAAQASNPSIDISNLAARDVVSYQTGRERQAIAQALEHGDTTGRGYQAHAANFAGKTDPRGFAWDTYTDEQKKAIAENVEKDENAKAKLARSINMARRLNLMAGN